MRRLGFAVQMDQQPSELLIASAALMISAASSTGVSDSPVPDWAFASLISACRSLHTRAVLVGSGCVELRKKASRQPVRDAVVGDRAAQVG